MQNKCSKCGKPVNQVGRLIKITWLGSRAPLCSECRKEIKKEPKARFSFAGLFRKLKRKPREKES